MLPPWHRTLLFWSGLPFFLALVWMWLGHVGTVGRVTANSRTEDYRISWGNGEIGICRVEKVYDVRHVGTTTISSLRKPGLRITREPAAPHDPFQLLGEDFYKGAGSTGFILGFWFVAVTYTNLWLGTLALWQLRKGRLTTYPLAKGFLPELRKTP